MNKSLKPALDSLNKCEHCREWFSRYNDALRRLGGITTAYRKAKKKLTAVTAERDYFQAELRRWQKSFKGHVYVKNEDYSGLIADRDRLRTLLSEAEGALSSLVAEWDAGWPGGKGEELFGNAGAVLAKLKTEGGKG